MLGARWCIGCFTAFPLFALLTPLLALWPVLPWHLGLASGLAMASAQAVSSLGLARTKAMKVLVKSSLGAGLALAVASIHLSPWPPILQAVALLALAAAAWASALPRRRRMASAAA